MPGDYSRFTDDPKRRVSSLLLQQGKVVLDADFNEESLTAEERRRLGALDTFGPAVVSKMAPGNDHAFELTVTGAPPNQDLSIGPGRMWVDGKLVQCFPNDGEDKADKTTKDRAPSYLHQPFLPEPKKLTDVSFPAVAYLDVWTREVTWVEEPDLLDKALGGVDTSTRLVTVWQVKLLEKKQGEPDPTCADILKLKPSGGRLTTDAVAPPAPDDPCLVSPAGGYRGIENRLYRVQIHQGGAAGTATFKWSRDNASLVSPVERIEVQGTKAVLTVARIGRDPVLRFQVDDWVELIDDRRELHGVPGEMARVESVDETTREIVLHRDVTVLPPGWTHPFAAAADAHEARHTRLIRWDQKQPPNTLDANGLVTVTTGAPIPLEDGIEIAIELALDSPGVPSSGVFHTGDWWVFAARTADGKVDELEKAPPRGIAHSYVPLAEVTSSAATGLVVRQPDCRVFWPPKGEGGKAECCCTVVVRPDVDDIQAAIDEVCQQGGGCVCLKAGEHTITAPLRIRCSGVSLVGESGATVVRAVRLAPLLEIHDPQGKPVTDTVVEGIRFVLVGGAFDAETALVTARDVERLALRDLGLEGSGPVPNLDGILFVHADEARVERCRIGRVDVGIKALEGSGTLILCDNTLENQLGEERERIGQVAIWLQDAREPCRIEGNRMSGFARGIVLSDRLSADLPAPDGDPRSEARGSWIGGNDIVFGPARTVDDITFRPIAIEVAADAARVNGNRIGLTADRAQGVLVIAASAVRVTDNVLVFAGRDADGAATDGIVVWSARDDASPVVVAGNVIRGLTFGIQSISARHTRIDGNAIAVTRSGIVLVDSTADLVTANDVQGGRHGIHLALAQDTSLHGNTLERAAEAAILGEKLRGTVTLDGNRVRFAAFEPPTEQPRAAVDLAADDDDPECEIVLDGCLVEEWGRVRPGEVLPPSPPLADVPPAVGVRIRAPRVAVRHNRIANPPLRDGEDADVEREHRALLVISLPANPNERLSGKVMALGNQFRGTGATALVEVQGVLDGNNNPVSGFARVSFSDNEVEHRSRQEGPARAASVSLAGGNLVVGDNQVTGQRGFASFVLFARNGTFIGNVMARQPNLFGAILPTPIAEAKKFNFWP